MNVGPIHAGIIEPGAFRFICNGETVLHLEIALGYQHRGIEKLMAATGNRLRQSALAESIAGDTAVAGATAFAEAVEKLAAQAAPEALVTERAVALELERMAMHIADTGALSMDVGYQLGQVACEALRTMTINTTQAWCGNRFGKGLVRPFGTNKPLTAEKVTMIRRNVAEIARRYNEVRQDIKSSPTLLARYEQCGVVPRAEMLRIGGVGMAARASGVERDLRVSHPSGIFARGIAHESIVKRHGDVMARLMMRCREVLQSAEYIDRMLESYAPAAQMPRPDYETRSRARLAGRGSRRGMARGVVPRSRNRRPGPHSRLPRQGPQPAQLAGAGAGRARRGHLRLPHLQQEFSTCRTAATTCSRHKTITP